MSAIFTRARILVLLAPWLLMAGCRSVGPVDLLEQELRHREFDVDEADTMLEECHVELESAYDRIERLEQQLAGSDGAGPAERSAPRGRRPDDEPVIPDATPPVIESGPLEDSAATGTDRTTTSAVRPAAALDRRVTDRRVTRIVFGRRGTGGWNTDAGSEGIRVSMQLRNVKGEPIMAVGDLSIRLVDPAQQGTRGQIGRWDFTAKDLAEYAAGDPASGMRFNLPWTTARPESQNLRLIVHFNPLSGRLITGQTALVLNDQPAVANSPVEPAPDESKVSRGPAWSDVRPLAPKDAPQPRLLPAAPESTRTPSVADSKANPARPQWKPYR